MPSLSWLVNHDLTNYDPPTLPPPTLLVLYVFLRFYIFSHHELLSPYPWIWKWENKLIGDCRLITSTHSFRKISIDHCESLDGNDMNTQHLKLSEVTRVDPTSSGALKLCVNNRGERPLVRSLIPLFASKCKDDFTRDKVSKTAAFHLGLTTIF